MGKCEGSVGGCRELEAILEASEQHGPILGHVQLMVGSDLSMKGSEKWPFWG